MAYDEQLVARVREALAGREAVSERKMFGGLAFMLDGNMCCGVIGDELVLRLGPEGADEALDKPHTRPMDFTGRPLKGFVFVAARGVETDDGLRSWVEQAAEFAASLAPK